MDRCRVLVIGWDGVPWELLHRFIALGHLPNLGRLMEGAAKGVLNSTIPPDTGASWTSFATGATPGHHGIFGWFAFDANLRPHLITANDIRVPTFYQALSQAGLRSILINLPVSYPPRVVNGIVVGDLLSPRAYIEPSHLSHYLDGYRVFYDTAKRGDDLVEDIIDVERRRMAVARQLFVQEDWDFFFTLVSGTDWMSHYCYRDLLQQTELGIRATRLFSMVDQDLGWFLEHIPAGTTLLLLSDHGFQACDRSFDINAWLAKEGLLRSRTKGAPKGEVDNAFTDTTPNEVQLPKTLAGFLRHFPMIRRAGARVLRSVDREVKLGSPVEVDQAGSIVFVPKGYTYGAYVNRRLVPAAEQRTQISKDVVDRLRGLRDPSTGQPVLEVVGSREEIYGPEASDLAPDILFLPSPRVYVDHSMLYGALVHPREGNYHHPEGFIVAAGPDVPPRRNLGNVPMWNVAPTILRLFGMDPLPTMDGRSIDGIPLG